MAERRIADSLAHPPSIASTVKTSYLAFLAGTAALGGFLFGFDSSVINGALGGIEHEFSASEAATGFAVASILLGAALGAILAGRLADGVGRKPVMLATAVVFGLTAAWAGLAHGTMEFTVARFVSGVAVGSASVVCPTYIAEISPAPIRGRLASLQQLGIVVGIFVALLSDHLIAGAAGGVTGTLGPGVSAWRWMFLVEVVPSAAFGIALLRVPESPRFLVARGRAGEALAFFQHIAPASAASEIAAIEKTVQRESPPRLADLLTAERRVRPVVWIGFALASLQQLVGINSIFYYGAVLWNSVGFTSADSLRINVLTGGVNIAATLVAMALVDKVGRRPLLLWGSVAMALTLGVLAFTFLTAHDGGASAGAGEGAKAAAVLSRGAGIVALVSANLYVFAFGVTWGPCVWVVLSEMFPNKIRGAGMAVAVFGQWIANWLVTVSFPIIVGALGASAAYGLYLFFSLISFEFVRRCIRETRGLSLEEM